MFRRFRRKWMVGRVSGLMCLSVCGCTPTDDTISSLVDLVASTVGGFVQILVKAAIDGALAPGGNQPNLDAPISTQSH